MSPVNGRVGLVVEILVPVGLYFGLTAVGWSTRVGLIAAAGGSAVLALVGVLRTRRVASLPIIMALGAVAGLVAGLISGSDRLLLVREAYVGVPLALGFVWSAFTVDPVLGRVYRALLATSGDKERLWSSSAWVSGQVRILTLIWGFVGLAGSAVQVVIAYTLPISTAVWATNLTVPLIVLAASVATGPSVTRLRRFLTTGPAGL